MSITAESTAEDVIEILKRTREQTERCLHPIGIERELDTELESIRNVIIEKNQHYGNSALEPLAIFSKGDPLTGINARIDDKLARIAYSDDDNEDSELDLIGYLLLRRIAKGRMGLAS